MPGQRIVSRIITDLSRAILTAWFWLRSLGQASTADDTSAASWYEQYGESKPPAHWLALIEESRMANGNDLPQTAFRAKSNRLNLSEVDNSAEAGSASPASLQTASTLLPRVRVLVKRLASKPPESTLKTTSQFDNTSSSRDQAAGKHDEPEIDPTNTASVKVTGHRNPRYIATSITAELPETYYTRVLSSCSNWRWRSKRSQPGQSETHYTSTPTVFPALPQERASSPDQTAPQESENTISEAPPATELPPRHFVPPEKPYAQPRHRAYERIQPDSAPNDLTETLNNISLSPLPQYSEATPRWESLLDEDDTLRAGGDPASAPLWGQKRQRERLRQAQRGERI